MVVDPCTNRIDWIEHEMVGPFLRIFELFEFNCLSRDTMIWPTTLAADTQPTSLLQVHFQTSDFK